MPNYKNRSTVSVIWELPVNTDRSHKGLKMNWKNNWNWIARNCPCPCM